MAMCVRSRLFPAVLAAIAVIVMASAAQGRAADAARGRAASTFPCSWSYSLYDGLRKGFVTAGDNADCAGRRGSLTLSVRLLKLDPTTRVWHTAKTRTRTFRRLNGNRFVEVAAPCAAASFRGIFRWTLRDGRGSVVARHRVNTPKLVVTSPDCQIMLGGPGTPVHAVRPAK